MSCGVCVAIVNKYDILIEDIFFGNVSHKRETHFVDLELGRGSVLHSAEL